VAELLKISELIRHGKALNMLKPALNVLFVSGITFTLIQKIYPSISIPEKFTLKGIIEYFLCGEFIIPFGIFFVVWALTKFAGSIFEVINFKITDRIGKIFDQFEFIKSEGAIEDAEFTPYMLVGVPKKRWAVRLYEAVRKKLTDAKIDEIQFRLNYARIQYTSDFVLIIRSIIAVCIYFNNVQYFGWLLLVIILVLQIILTALIFIGYQLAALLPIVGAKYSAEYKKYQRQHDIIYGKNSE
jgi:hypothetical protein